jgi:hypothetical protein
MSKDQGPFYKIPDAPASLNAGAVLGRLVDSLGFRFRWATEGMGDADLSYKPAADCMTHEDLLVHIHDLLDSVARNVGMPPGDPLSEQVPCEVLRSLVLDLCAGLSARFKALTDDDLAGRAPGLWNMINGPLADCLTHVGQILSWRRLAGAPPAPADLFRGLPPAGA